MSIRYPVGKPFLDRADIQSVTDALKNSQLTQGVNVRRFESLLASHLEVRNVVACSSGTAALHLALVTAGIGPGDEVLIPDLTYISTANAVRYVNARVIPVDVDEETWNIDLKVASNKISNRTKAIIPVHLYGTPCNMDEVLRFSFFHNLTVIEDAAEAIGGKWKNNALGTFGHMGMFSFYGNKVITTGEGGAVVTDNDEWANTLRFFRGQAQSSRRFFHEAVGYNYRLTDIQASLGITQLDKIKRLLSRRQIIVDRYREMLREVLRFPVVAGSAPWLFTGIMNAPYAVVEAALLKVGIEVRPMFVPMHRQPMYLQLDNRFPVSSSLADRGISFPTYPDLTDEDITYIGSMAREVIYEASRRRSPF